MSPKAKKYRRANTPSVASTAPAASTQTNPVVRADSRNLSTAIPVPTAQAFKRDLAFIGLTTLIIIILMILAYYLIPR